MTAPDATLTAWKLVPVEPTPEMYCAGDERLIEAITPKAVIAYNPTPAQAVWAAMIAAAPLPPLSDAKASCADCRFAEPFNATTKECRRYPPVHVAAGKFRWASVLPTDWCGEHKPKEVTHASGCGCILDPACRYHASVTGAEAKARSRTRREPEEPQA